MLMEKFKENQKSLNEYKHIIGVLIGLSEGSAIKFIAHRGYDSLLCNHVYMSFCPQCPQYKCKKRRI